MTIRRIIESTLKLALVAALFAAAQALAAQPPAPPRPPYWNVDYGEFYCVLARFNGADAVNFGLRVVPGTLRTELLITSSGWQQLPIENGQTVDLFVEPVAGPISVQASAGRLSSGDRYVLLRALEPAFVDRFAQANGLRVVGGDRTILDTDFPHAGSAVRALRRCVDQRLAEWGIDTTFRATLRSLPIATEIPFDDAHYPLAALIDEAQGDTIVRVTVGTDGKVSDCAVVRSSGSIWLDERTCQRYRDDGRFRPAIGADGQPAEARLILLISWRIAG